MKKILSLLLSLVILLTTLSYTSIVKAESNMEVNISLFRGIPSGTTNYIECMLYPDSNIGAEIRIKNNDTQAATIKPFAALYYKNILKSIKTKEYALNGGEETLYRPDFFIPSENIANYTIKYFVWNSNMQPLIDPITINNMYLDYYGDSFENAIFVTEDKAIEGRINTASESDYVKFIAQNTGAYTISAYGSSISGYLYNSSHSLITSDSGDGCYTLNANLTAGQAYFIKTSGMLSCDYSVLIQNNQGIAKFDIYQYDSEIKGYKDSIISLCEKAYDDNNATLSQEIYNKYEQAYDTDLLLHEMPDSLKNLSKDSSAYDASVKTYYASKKSEFESLRQTYIDIYSEYEYSTGAGSPFPPGVIAQSSDFGPNGMSSMSETTIPDDIEYDDTNEVNSNSVSLMSSTANLTITSKTDTSVTFTVTYPSNYALGNVIALTDFNQGTTIEYLPFDIDRSGSTKNDWKLRNGTYTISGLVPGGMYYIWAAWSTDGGSHVYWKDSVLRRVQLPPIADQQMTLTQGSYVTANIETNDKAIASTSNFNKWLGNMDSVYSSLQDFTGYTPYNGRKIQIKSTRQDMNGSNPDGVNYWQLTWGWSGNPILISRPFYRSIMQRLSSGDWGDVIIHELSHDFDMDEWCFDYEVLADLKLSYILQTKSSAKIYRPDTDKYYTGNNIYDFFYSDQANSYQYSFADGYYNNRGMTAIMLRIKNELGSWDAFRKTFRYMADLSNDEYDYIYSSSSRDPEMGKFNIFITKLRDFSKKDIISKLTASEKNIIENQYGGVISYYVSPPPVISGGNGGNSTVNLPSGEYTIRRFIPTTSGSYNIYTSPFGGTGISNDTVIDVYSNETLTNLIGSNDDYGSSRFSKVTVNLSAYQTYYIKLRHYNNSGEIHADLKVTKNTSPISLSTDVPVNVQVAALEYSTLSFTPTTSGQYLFTSGQYNGTTQTTNKDSILVLYRNEALTNRIVSSQYVAGTFPQISAELTAGVTYYLTFTGYLNKAARSRIIVTGSLSSINDVSNLDYNNGNGPMLGYSNTLKFNINRNDTSSATYYIVPSLGWDNVYFYEKTSSGVLKTLNGTSNEITINDIPLTSGGSSILYTKIKIYNNASANKILLWESPVAAKPRNNNALANLSFAKSSESSFIYMNSPEYITKYDLVDNQEEYPENNPFSNSTLRNKLFEVKDVSGKNTFYQTNTSWWGGLATQYEPSDSFYVDIDFYNPTSNAITISIKKLAYGNEYSVMQNYYNGSGRNTDIVVPAYEHRLLFETLKAPLKLSHPGTEPPLDWNWNRHRIPVILFDFEAIGGNVTVSSLAAYNRNNLYLRNETDNILNSTGETIGNGGIIYNTDATGKTIWDGEIGDPRPNETDLYGKYKGIAKNQSAWIDSTINFIIDDAIPSGQHLRVNLSDTYYPDGVANPKLWWMTNINPFNDKWAGVIFAMPGVGHSYTYSRSSGGIWNFAFDYKNLKDINANAEGNNLITKQMDETIINNAKLDVASGWKEHFPNYPDDGDPTTDESRPVDEDSMSIGSWGATNHYTVTVQNVGNNDRSISYQVNTINNMIFGYKGANDSNYSTQYIPEVVSDDNVWETPVTVNIPAHSTVTFEVVTNLGGGHGGPHTQIVIN